MQINSSLIKMLTVTMLVTSQGHKAESALVLLPEEVKKVFKYDYEFSSSLEESALELKGLKGNVTITSLSIDPEEKNKTRWDANKNKKVVVTSSWPLEKELNEQKDILTFSFLDTLKENAELPEINIIMPLNLNFIMKSLGGEWNLGELSGKKTSITVAGKSNVKAGQIAGKDISITLTDGSIMTVDNVFCKTTKPLKSATAEGSKLNISNYIGNPIKNSNVKNSKDYTEEKKLTMLNGGVVGLTQDTEKKVLNKGPSQQTSPMAIPIKGSERDISPPNNPRTSPPTKKLGTSLPKNIETQEGRALPGAPLGSSKSEGNLPKIPVSPVTKLRSNTTGSKLEGLSPSPNILNEIRKGLRPVSQQNLGVSPGIGPLVPQEKKKDEISSSTLSASPKTEKAPVLGRTRQYSENTEHLQDLLKKAQDEDKKLKEQTKQTEKTPPSTPPTPKKTFLNLWGLWGRS